MAISVDLQPDSANPKAVLVAGTTTKTTLHHVTRGCIFGFSDRMMLPQSITASVLVNRTVGWPKIVIQRYLESYVPALASCTVALAIILSGCEYTTIDNSMIVEPQGPVSYTNDVLPILKKGCEGFGCHFGFEASGVELSSYEYTIGSIGTQYGSEVVTPGDGADSPLIDKMFPSPEFGQIMPIGPALTASEINIIKTWIDEGAINN